MAVAVVVFHSCVTKVLASIVVHWFEIHQKWSEHRRGISMVRNFI